MHMVHMYISDTLYDIRISYCSSTNKQMETTDKAKWEGLNLRPDHNVVKKYLAKH